MPETAKILNPTKKVLLSDPKRVLLQPKVIIKWLIINKLTL
jgi:hypothetical protein